MGSRPDYSRGNINMANVRKGAPSTQALFARNCIFQNDKDALLQNAHELPASEALDFATICSNVDMIDFIHANASLFAPESVVDEWYLGYIADSIDPRNYESQAVLKGPAVFAVRNNRLDIVKKLFDMGYTHLDQYSLVFAANNDNLDMVKFVVEHAQTFAPIQYAATSDEVYAYLSMFVDVVKKQSPLHVIMTGTVDAFLDMAREYQSKLWEVLDLAACYGRADIVKVVYENRHLFTDVRGYSHAETIRLFNTGDVRWRRWEQVCTTGAPLQLACMYGHLETAKLIHEYELDGSFCKKRAMADALKYDYPHVTEWLNTV
jgi:hypothetical protein